MKLGRFVRNPTQSRSKRRLVLEALEPRRMMAGNVTAFLESTGQLRIIGDNSSNAVEIAEVSPGTGRYQVRGIGLDGNTAVNGSLSPTAFSGVASISVCMQGGNDAVSVRGSLLKDGFNSCPRVNIDLGDGNNTLNLSYLQDTRIPSGSVIATFGYDTIKAGSGDDHIYLDHVNWSGNRWTIDTGGGRDVLSITYSAFSASQGGIVTIPSQSSLDIQMGSGTDQLLVDSSTLNGLTANLGADNDAATVTNCVFGDSDAQLFLDGSTGCDTLTTGGNDRDPLSYGFDVPDNDPAQPNDPGDSDPNHSPHSGQAGPAPTSWYAYKDGVLTITGGYKRQTDGTLLYVDKGTEVTLSGTNVLSATYNGETQVLGPLSDYKKIVFYGSDKDDAFTNNTSIDCEAQGFGGNDKLYGDTPYDYSGNISFPGDFRDNDKLDGRLGSNRLDGGYGNDRFIGKPQPGEVDRFFHVEYSVTPAAPTGLRVSNVTTQSADLNWTDNAANESLYRIYISSDQGATWRLKGIVGIDATTYHVENLTAGTRYKFRVQAVNGNIGSDFSNIVKAATVLQAPTNLTANALKRAVELSWTDNASNETGYNIAISTDGGKTWKNVGKVGANVTSFRVENLDPGSRYLFKVRAVNDDLFSDYSNILDVQTKKS
jgi:hypothetical protein